MSKNPVGFVEKITTFSKRYNGREKILSDVNSRSCYLYNKTNTTGAINAVSDVRKKRLFVAKQYFADF